jgi:hypothetical protein
MHTEAVLRAFGVPLEPAPAGLVFEVWVSAEIDEMSMAKIKQLSIFRPACPAPSRA